MPIIAEDRIAEDRATVLKSFERFLNENFRSKDSKGSIINSLTFEFGEMPSAGVSCEQGIEQKIDDGEFRGNFRMPIRAVRIRKVCHDKDCSDYHFETVGSIV
jgi:hypothetical protein